MIVNPLVFYTQNKLQAIPKGSEVFSPSFKAVEIKTDITLEDRKRIKKLQDAVYTCEGETGKPVHTIYMGKNMFLSVFKYMYNVSNGMITFETFEGINTVLLSNVNPDFIELNSWNDNQEKLFDMLFKKGDD